MLIGGGVAKSKEATKRVSFKTDEAPNEEDLQVEKEMNDEEQVESRRESKHEDPDVSVACVPDC